jgi:hypothetical protein
MITLCGGLNGCQIFDRLGDVIAATIMMRKLVQMIFQLLGEHRLQRQSGALVHGQMGTGFPECPVCGATR